MFTRDCLLEGPRAERPTIPFQHLIQVPQVFHLDVPRRVSRVTDPHGIAAGLCGLVRSTYAFATRSRFIQSHSLRPSATWQTLHFSDSYHMPRLRSHSALLQSFSKMSPTVRPLQDPDHSDTKFSLASRTLRPSSRSRETFLAIHILYLPTGEEPTSAPEAQSIGLCVSPALKGRRMEACLAALLHIQGGASDWRMVSQDINVEGIT